MEKPSLVRHHGVLRLPPGFRFHPTDEELVVQYLKRKVFSCPLPASIIPEIDLGKHNPWDLPGGCEQERYFFTLREAKYPNGSRSNRSTGTGYWKATGKDKPVVASKGNQVVGMKKVLVFYQGKPPSGSRTDWVMHEYRLVSSESGTCVSPQRKNSVHNAMTPMGDWVLIRIFRKKRAPKAGMEAGEYLNGRRVLSYIDFMGQQNSRPCTSSTSDSSCVTENVDGSSNGEDISSPP